MLLKEQNNTIISCESQCVGKGSNMIAQARSTALMTISMSAIAQSHVNLPGINAGLSPFFLLSKILVQAVSKTKI